MKAPLSLESYKSPAKSNPGSWSNRQLPTKFSRAGHACKTPSYLSTPPVRQSPNDPIRLAPDCYLLQPCYLFSNLAGGKIAPAWWLIFKGDILPHCAAALRACCRTDEGRRVLVSVESLGLNDPLWLDLLTRVLTLSQVWRKWSERKVPVDVWTEPAFADSVCSCRLSFLIDGLQVIQEILYINVFGFFHCLAQKVMEVRNFQLEKRNLMVPVIGTHFPGSETGNHPLTIIFPPPYPAFLSKSVGLGADVCGHAAFGKFFFCIIIIFV